MKNLKRTIWGLIFIAAAVIIALNSFDIIDFDLFFDGWWTLFIIVPSLVGVIQDRNKGGAVFGLCVGILLLLSAQEIISWDMIWKISLPLIIALIGLKMVFSSFKKDKTDRVIKEIKHNTKDAQNGAAVFCGTELNFDNVVFDGANLSAVFGSIDCDLRNAIIEKDCVINVSCVFGGVDILVPDNVKVVANTTSIFGGIDVMKNNHSGVHTIYIDGSCIFGGIDVK
jgi:predicted membrane protein